MQYLYADAVDNKRCCRLRRWRVSGDRRLKGQSVSQSVSSCQLTGGKERTVVCVHSAAAGAQLESHINVEMDSNKDKIMAADDSNFQEKEERDLSLLQAYVPK